MVWLEVSEDGPNLFKYKELGMQKKKKVSDSRRVNVSEDVAHNLTEKHPDVFDYTEDENEEDENDKEEDLFNDGEVN